MNIWKICLFLVANGGKSDKGVRFDNIFSQLFEFSASKFASPRTRV
jgi:hypothetical protein